LQLSFTMPRYKRTADDAELDAIPLEPEIAPDQIETRDKLRNMWEFASLMQYIHLFGDAVKIDKAVDIEVRESISSIGLRVPYVPDRLMMNADDLRWKQRLEAECLTSEPSPKLADIGLQLLKYVSSHRGLT
jgi:hypothetical protein